MFHLVAPGVPRFVVMRITPFAASVPYSVAAAGPFTISMDSMSSGLMSSSRDGSCPPEKREKSSEVFTRMPSTYTSGSFDSDMLLAPRMRIRLPMPGVPLELKTWTPAVRPWSSSAMLVIGATSVTSAAAIEETALPSSRTRCAPTAVTTTSSSAIAARSSAKSRIAAWPAATVTLCVTWP